MLELNYSRWDSKSSPLKMFIEALTITPVKICCHVMIIIILMSMIININIINKKKLITFFIYLISLLLLNIINIINIIKYY